MIYVIFSSCMHSMLYLCSCIVFSTFNNRRALYSLLICFKKTGQFTLTIIGRISLYFHLVSTNCEMTQILDIFITHKQNKTNPKTTFKSQDENKYLQVKLIDYILTPSWVPSNFVLPQFLPHIIYVYLKSSVLSSDIQRESWYINYNVLFFYHLVLTLL